MTTVDLIIIAFTVLLAAGGFRQGFVVGALSLAGFIAGAYLGTRAAPLLLPEGSSSPYAPIFGLMGAFLGGVIFSLSFEGFATALRQSFLAVPGARSVDGLLGAALAAALALAISWVAGAVALQTPSARELRGDIQRSEILSRLNAALPPSGGLLNALARIDPFPTLDGPAADVAPPRAAIARDPEVAAAAGSVVRILGTACGLGLEGSGYVAGDGLVVTNAHVIAGEEDTTVQVGGDGPKFDAQPVFYDPKNDLAILRVSNLQGVRPLPLADEAESGTEAAVLGFPLNGPYDVRAARLASTRTVLSQDAYGRGPVRRAITSFRANVRPGNSGGPVVDGRGRVVATVFATASGSARRTGYGVPNKVVADALAGPLRPVSSGPCAP
ncbi:MAG: MarP family serine protease [Solirubrobacterales bacterium]|nr:MarP family serine protease [Solirubrobacterales bacterium]